MTAAIQEKTTRGRVPATRTAPPARPAAPPASQTASRTAASPSARNQTPPAGAGDLVTPVSGLVDLRDGHAFLRTSGYRAARDDVLLTQSQARQYGLRTGDLVTGAARAAGAGQPSRGRSRHRTLASLDTVNGGPVAAARQRPRFDQLTPLHPDERLRLDGGAAAPAARIIDLVSPVGKGQRGLIVAPPKAGKTMVLQAIAAAVTAGHPAAQLMVVLVGERPEEVTDLRRTVRGEVIYSTFDAAAADHVMVAELAIERARRLAELGQDVVVLLDSITRLGRAYNLAAPASSRILTGGVAASALQGPRQFLGAARNLEDAGSLTILATALAETGSRMDDVFFEELKGTGNMELRLRRDLAERGLFPAVDVTASGTRRDELLMAADEYAAVTGLRRALAGLEPRQALELLLGKIQQTGSNAELLLAVSDEGAGRPARWRP